MKISFSEQTKQKMGKILRVDINLNFSDPSSWSVFDIAANKDAGLIGFAGASCVLNAVFFTPYQQQYTPFHNRFLRYNTTRKTQRNFILQSKFYFIFLLFIVDFFQSSSYDFVDTAALLGYSNPIGFVGLCKVGNFLYLPPFQSNIGVQALVLRYDWTKPLSNVDSWSMYNATNTNNLKVGGFFGCTSDETHVYFVPYTNLTLPQGKALRVDTTLPFNDSSAWSAIDLDPTNGLRAVGFKQGTYDGNYVYFAVRTKGTETKKKFTFVCFIHLFF